MRPEYQASIGGSHATPKNATSICPRTLKAKRARSAQSRTLLFLKHPFVVPEPLALEQLLRVVLELELEEFLQLRVAGVHLAAQAVAVVGRVVAAAVLEADVDQAPEHVARLDQAAGGVLDVHVEDHAGVGLARPRQEALAVLLDEAHGAVDDVDLVAPRIVAHLHHEALELLALAVDLGDRLGALHLRAQPLVERAVVVLRVHAHLRVVRPVHLAVGLQVEAGVAPERLALGLVREVQQLGPLAFAQLALVRRHRRVGLHRAVAREHAAVEEVAGSLVDRVLEVAVEVAVADALGERLRQAVDRAHFHHALDLAALDQAQRRRSDQSEQAVAANRQAEQVRVVGAAAVDELAPGGEQPERLDVADEGRHLQAAAVDIGGQAAADGQLVGAGLLLRESPLLLAAFLCAIQHLEELRPLHAGLDLEVPLLLVEGQHLRQAPRIDHQPVGEELLAAHGVARAREADLLLLLLRGLDGVAHAVERVGLHDAPHAGRVELRVDVVDQDPRRRLVLLAGLGKRARRPSERRRLQKVTTTEQAYSSSERETGVVPFFGRPGRLVRAKMRSGGTGGGASMKRQSDSLGTLISAPMRLPLSITV